MSGIQLRGKWVGKLSAYVYWNISMWFTVSIMKGYVIVSIPTVGMTSRTTIPDFTAARCGHMSQVWPVSYKWISLGGGVLEKLLVRTGLVNMPIQLFILLAFFLPSFSAWSMIQWLKTQRSFSGHEDSSNMLNVVEQEGRRLNPWAVTPSLDNLSLDILVYKVNNLLGI